MKKPNPKFYATLVLCVLMPLAIIYSQLLQGIFIIMYSALIALIYKRKGYIAATACVIAGLASLWFSTYDGISAILMLCPIFLGLVLGEGFRTGRNFKTLLLRGTTAFIIPMIVLICAAAGEINNFVDIIFMEFLEEVKIFAQANPDSAGTLVADFSQMLDYTKEAFLRFIPALAIITGLAACYLSIVFAKYLLKISGLRFVYVPSFAFLRLGRPMTTFMMVSSLLAMLPIDEKAVAAFENITVIMLALAFACGLSVIDFYVRQKISFAGTRFLIYIVTIITTLMFTGLPLTILCIIGIIDSFFKLRIVRTMEG